jgi:hypothetical protein
VPWFPPPTPSLSRSPTSVSCPLLVSCGLDSRGTRQTQPVVTLILERAVRARWVLTFAPTRFLSRRHFPRLIVVSLSATPRCLGLSIFTRASFRSEKSAQLRNPHGHSCCDQLEVLVKARRTKVQAIRSGRVEDRRGSLGHLATLRFPSSLMEPDVPISGIRLSDWFHHEAHSVAARGRRSRRRRPSSP